MYKLIIDDSNLLMKEYKSIVKNNKLLTSKYTETKLMGLTLSTTLRKEEDICKHLDMLLSNWKKLSFASQAPITGIKNLIQLLDIK